jgi:hemolysin III
LKLPQQRRISISSGDSGQQPGEDLQHRVERVAHDAAAFAKETIYSFGEELAHGVTHGIGALLAIAGLAIMVAKAALYGHTIHIVAVSIFGSSLILMYAASTLFHSIPMPRTKHVFRIIDHCLIYVLIAGTYTPFTLITLHGTYWGWPLFAFTWGLAAVGILFKLFFTGRFEVLSLIVYLAMGWCGVVAGKAIYHAMDAGGLWLLVAGGVAYSLGTIFYAWTRLRYSHAIWHGFVLAGSALHFFCVLFYILPDRGA